MKSFSLPAFALIASVGLIGSAGAAQTEVDISSQVNADIQTYTDGGNYPQAPATVTIGGIDFAIAPYPAGAASGGSGVVQVVSPTDTFTFDVSLPGVTTVYTLINSAFGNLGSTVGSLTFGDSNGDVVTFDLTEGLNIRDHYDGFYNNDASDLYGTASYPGGVHLDAQQFILPGAFAASTLTSITFNGVADTGLGGGEPFLAAVTATTSAVPEPSTWAMMLAGLAGLGWLGYMRRRAIGVEAA